jgi:hypothetical protein
LPKADTWTFRSCDELIAHLKKRNWRSDLNEAHNKEADLGPLSAVYRSVGSSTFRAFRAYEGWSPSFVFRDWSGRELVGGKFSELQSVRSNDQYRSWAVELAKGLCKQWQRRLRYSLEIPRALKLVNLLAKGLCIVTPLWPKNFEAIIQYVEVPLDKYSLRPLACIPELGNIGITWKNASMGSIKDLKTYAKLQDSIRIFCEKANVPPLAYDLFAWDHPHGKPKS